MDNEIIQDTGYGLIPKSIMRSKSLSIQAKALYSYLASFAGNTGQAFPSVSLIMGEMGIAKSTFYKYIDELKESGAINVKQERTKGKFTRNIYCLNNEVKAPCPKIPNTAKRDTVKWDTKSSDSISNSIISNSIKSNSSKDIVVLDKKEKEAPEIPYKEIVDYLNKSAGSSYRPVTNKTRTLIKARFNESFTLEDFKKVIDIKVAEWKNTDMGKFLRPETLFGNKFEGYLNQGGINNATNKAGSGTNPASEYDFSRFYG